MLIENGFTVQRPVDEVWNYLLDVERIAPCMPGAELTEVVDDHTWNGKVNMAFGPVKMSFAGSVSMEERDDAAHRVALKAKGTEQKGKGAANATVTSWLEPVDGGTKVSMQADITLTGAAAQLSRGLLPEVSKRLTQQFADCLEESLAANATATAAAEGAGPAVEAGAAEAPPAAAPKPAPVAAKPVGGIRLGLAAIWSVIAGFFRRLFGGGSKPSS
ncbi:MAG TPA: SRPBCC family protein [Actinomycetota bacterium]|nr:SRPBCC family protein [Actinomycetota bacterium]